MSRPFSIAVVDDDALILRSVIRHLRRADYDCVGYRTAEEFVEVAAVALPDLLLSDVELGLGMSGFDLRRRFGAVLPTLLMSGTARYGIDLFKPFTAAELLGAVGASIAATPPAEFAALPRTPSQA